MARAISITIIAGIANPIASQDPTAAMPVVPAHRIDENASAKVAAREEV